MHVVECLTNSDLGGAQFVVHAFVRAIRHAHADVRFTIFLPSGGVFVERFKSLGVDVIELPFNRLSPFTFWHVWRTLRSLSAAVVHSHGKGAGLYARAIPRSSASLRRVHSHHGFHAPASIFLRRLYLMLESFLVRRTDSFIAVSESEASDIVRCYPSAKDRVRVIPNVVDCASLTVRANEALPEFLQLFLEKNSDSFIVTMIARDDEVKNHSLAFEACRILLGRNQLFAFAFVGIDGERADYCCLNGAFPEKTIAIASLNNPAPLIRKSNALLLTSIKEAGLPLVFQESFCLGKPVIGTNVPGIRETVQNEVNGLLCAETPIDVANALARLFDDRVLYAKLCANAIETAKASNSSAWAEQYVQIYSRLSNGE